MEVLRLESEVILESTSRWRSLTGSSAADNVLTALCLLFVSWMLGSIVELMVYAKRKTGDDTISYAGMARLEVLDSLSRKSMRKNQLDVGDAKILRYNERNLRHVIVVGLTALFLMVVEVLLFVSALPSRSSIMVRSDELITGAVTDLKKPTLLSYATNPCIISDKIEGVNVESAGSWSACSVTLTTVSRFGPVAEGTGIFIANVKEENNSRVSASFTFRNLTLQMDISFRVRINDSVEAFGNMDVGATELLEAMDKNMKGLSSATGVRVTNSSLEAGSVLMVVDYSGAQVLPNMSTVEVDAAALAGVYLRDSLQAVIRAKTGGGRDLLLIGTDPETTYLDAEVLVGTYVGPYITTLGSLVLAGVTIVILIVGRAFLESPPGHGWVLVTAFNRKCADRILAGPEQVLKYTKSKDTNGTGHVGYGLPEGHVEVAGFEARDEVAAQRPRVREDESSRSSDAQHLWKARFRGSKNQL